MKEIWNPNTIICLLKKQVSTRKSVTITLLTILLYVTNGMAQDESLTLYDTLPKKEIATDKVSLLVYGRAIRDAKGAFRTDQNFIGNFKLFTWLKLEAGIRSGERPSSPASYYHYKIELQTRSFWKTMRLIGRLSDNVINYPSPSYRKTNKLFVVEIKRPLSGKFQILAAGGYVFSSRQDNVPDALPTNKGVQDNYPLFKLALRYLVMEKGHLELAYGSYDVFNPYVLNSPFIQLTLDHDLSNACSLYSYFRYQYNNNVFTPNNYFLAAGLLFHFVK